MAGLLGDIYSAGDTLKRRLRGLLDDPVGTIGLGVDRFGEDQRGQYLATSPDSASSYALREGDGVNVIPAYAAVKRPMQVTTGKDLITRMPDGTDTRALIGANLDGAKIKEIAKNAGHDGVFQVKPNGNVGDIVTFDPSTIRSRFAAFDPMRRNEADLLGRADPALLAAMAGSGLLGFGAYGASKYR